MRYHRFFLVFVALTLAAACQSTRVAPINTASQPLALETDERKLWDEAQRIERRIEEVGLVYSNAELEAYVHSVAVGLVSNQLQNPDTELKVRVLRVPYRNACTFPNGMFYITTGMLACLDNEAELATVMGHELTHFIRRHTLKESRSAANKNAWVNVLGGTSMLIGLGPIFGQLGSVVATSAFLGYSRELENEADEQGLEDLVQAGYDPSVVLKVFDYLHEEEALEGVTTKGRQSTHPEIQERQDHYRELLATRYAAAVGEPGRRINRDEYLGNIRQLLLDNALLDERLERLEFARRGVDKYIARWPDGAPGYLSRGELCRRGRGPDAQAEAETAYREAVQLDPCYAEPRRELGLLCRATGRPQEARDEFAAYLEIAPEAVDARTILRYVAELDAELNKPPLP